jgi:pyruvate dehydrogenase E1 component
MFGLQRIGDLIWAAGDQRTRGFLVGGTAGRTTLAGEGLQHQDGHSHLLAYPVPNLVTYDPAFAFELAVIIRDGIRRMYEQGESIFYYVTVGNENYAQPSTPKHLDAKSLQSGILKGMYRFKPTSRKKVAEPRAHLFGSGAILNEAVKAQQILEEEFDVATDVWSITSFKELHRDGEEIERWNRMHPTEKPKIPYVTECLTNEVGVFVVVSDYVKALPESIARWFPKPPAALGTDGFGRSEARAELRDFFEVDARHIVVATLFELGKEKKIKPDVVEKAMKRFKINSEKANPLRL